MYLYVDYVHKQSIRAYNLTVRSKYIIYSAVMVKQLLRCQSNVLISFYVFVRWLLLHFFGLFWPNVTAYAPRRSTHFILYLSIFLSTTNILEFRHHCSLLQLSNHLTWRADLWYLIISCQASLPLSLVQRAAASLEAGLGQHQFHRLQWGRTSTPTRLVN